MRAISVFRLEAGISTFWCRARIALRIRVSMSATGSVNFIRFASPQPPVLSALAENQRWLLTLHSLFVVGRSPSPRMAAIFGRRPTTFLYHDDYETPGISPRNANPRKHSRQ